MTTMIIMTLIRILTVMMMMMMMMIIFAMIISHARSLFNNELHSFEYIRLHELPNLAKLSV